MQKQPFAPVEPPNINQPRPGRPGRDATQFNLQVPQLILPVLPQFKVNLAKLKEIREVKADDEGAAEDLDKPSAPKP